jgi:hypothetical protein
MDLVDGEGVGQGEGKFKHIHKLDGAVNRAYYAQRVCKVSYL